MFSAVYNILESLQLRGPGPGFVGRITTNIIQYIQTGGGGSFTSQVWGSIAQARPNNTF